jgi:hypothetical protein
MHALLGLEVAHDVPGRGAPPSSWQAGRSIALPTMSRSATSVAPIAELRIGPPRLLWRGPLQA